MPNEFIKTKGPYEIVKKYRHREERQKEWLYQISKRTYIPKRKYTLCRLIKFLGYLFSFYGVLVVIIVLEYLIVFKLRIPEHKPLRRKIASLSSVPGNAVSDGKLIRYKENQRHELTPYIGQIEKFMKKYGHEGITHLRECNLDNFWGYNSGLPCILLKLNYAYNFRAVTYSNAIALPSRVPNDLHDYVLQLSVEQRRHRIWMGCNFADKNIEANIEYIPHRYYDSDGLFKKKNIYLQSISENLTEQEFRENPAYRRVIGIKLQNLPINRDVILKCTAWAKNIPLHLATILFIIHIEGIELPENNTAIVED